jgi:hypothetical protein
MDVRRADSAQELVDLADEQRAVVGHAEAVGVSASVGAVGEGPQPVLMQRSDDPVPKVQRDRQAGDEHDQRAVGRT